MFVGTFFFITYRLCNKVGKRKVSSSDNMHTYVSKVFSNYAFEVKKTRTSEKLEKKSQFVERNSNKVPHSFNKTFAE